MGDGCQERSVDGFVSGLSVKGPWRLGGLGVYAVFSRISNLMVRIGLLFLMTMTLFRSIFDSLLMI